MWNLILFIGNIKMTIVMFSPVTLLIVAAVFLSLRTNHQLSGYNSFGVRESDKFDQKYNEVKRMALICSVSCSNAYFLAHLDDDSVGVGKKHKCRRV